jgi:undecaprenyl-diphosphatase
MLALALVGMVAAAMFVSLLLVVSTQGAPAPGWDPVLRGWALAHRSRRLTGVAASLSRTGPAVVGTVLVSGASLLLARGDVVRRAGVVAQWAAAMVIPSIARWAISTLVARQRPTRTGWLADAHGYAFPSGHAMASATAAGLLTWLAASRLKHTAARGAAGLVALVWAAAVGWSRVYLGVHWPSDVLGGWCLAITWLALLQMLGFPRDHGSQTVHGAGSFRWQRGRGRAGRATG